MNRLSTPRRTDATQRLRNLQGLFVAVGRYRQVLANPAFEPRRNSTCALRLLHHAPGSTLPLGVLLTASSPNACRLRPCVA